MNGFAFSPIAITLFYTYTQAHRTLSMFAPNDLNNLTFVIAECVCKLHN